MNLEALNLTDEAWRTALVFLLVFLLNIIPAFAPPTWAALSAFSLTTPDVDTFGLALTAAAAAASGRMTLAKAARRLVRGRWLSEKSKQNVDQIKTRIEANRVASAAGLALFAALVDLGGNDRAVGDQRIELGLEPIMRFLSQPGLLGVGHRCSFVVEHAAR